MDLISEKRLGQYLQESNDQDREALRLYEWSARMAADLFELVGHAEVILRNAIDRQMSISLDEDQRGIPWFLLNLPVQANVGTQALSYEYAADRNSVLANLTMGYWANLVGQRKLWDHLSGAFKEGSTQASVESKVRLLHELRNRLAHHAPMLEVDIPMHIRNIFELMDMINAECTAWLREVDRATATYGSIPVATPDTLLVPAKRAWPAYQEKNIAAYVCQAGRSFRPVRRLAFYYNKAIQREIPLILDHRDHVRWTEEHALELESHNDALDFKLADIIRRTRSLGWTQDEHQVFLLTGKGAAGKGEGGHVQLARTIPHDKEGRGSAFVHAQRYFHLSDLRGASKTSDLPRSYFYEYAEESAETDDPSGDRPAVTQ